MSKISVVKGDDRYDNVFGALSLIGSEIGEKIGGRKSVVIKPNMVSTRRQLSATHRDALRAVLDFITPLFSGKIVIAGNPAIGSAMDGFRNYGYLDLKEEYDVEFFDLQNDSFQEVELFDRELKPMKFRIARILAQSDFLISLAIPKTHDTVVATLSLKNTAVGCLDNKSQIHQGYRGINKSLAKLAEVVGPDLGVLDGFLAMEGNGPIDGEPVPMRVALAGVDFLALDTAGAYLMGFDPCDIGYLHWIRKKGLGEGDLRRIDVVGDVTLDEVRRRFKPHSGYEEQLGWK